MKKPFPSTLSPHAQPYFSSTRFPSTSSSSSVFRPSTIELPHAIDYDNPYSAYMYHFSDYWDPTPVSATPSSHVTVKPAPPPSSTLQNLQVQIASSKLSSDDHDSLIDSPCYKGRNWSPITPLHIGQTSPPPRVTVDSLAEEHNVSAAVAAIASLMVSHEKENGLSSLPVSVGVLDHPPHDNPANQALDPGFKREGILQTIVDLSNMLLQIPLNVADLSESDYEMVNVIIKDLKKLQEEYKKNCYLDDNVDNIEAAVYKDLWMSAKLEKHEMVYKLQHARMAVDTETNN